MKTTRNGIAVIACLMLCTGFAMAQDKGGKPDPFKGKLFAPDIILRNQTELNLSKEQFTGIKGKYVSIAESIKGFKEIVAGKHDDLPEQAFYLVGTIEEAVEKAAGMKAA